MTTGYHLPPDAGMEIRNGGGRGHALRARWSGRKGRVRAARRTRVRNRTAMARLDRVLGANNRTFPVTTMSQYHQEHPSTHSTSMRGSLTTAVEAASSSADDNIPSQCHDRDDRSVHHQWHCPNYPPQMITGAGPFKSHHRTWW